MGMSRFSPALAVSAALALLLAFSAHAQTHRRRHADAGGSSRSALRRRSRPAQARQRRQPGRWIELTNITLDTEAVAAEANEAYVNASTTFAKAAARFQKTDVSPSERRQLELLRTSLTMAAPPDPVAAAELTRVAVAMEGVYGRGKFCPSGATGDDCLDIEEITEILAESRDPTRLQEVWEGWHSIAVPIKKDYVRFVELSNAGARALGFADTGAMWRGKSRHAA